jgi:CHAD domain-containing protein
MFSHTERVRVGEDIEGVHDMRVGSRRLVAAMRVFAEAFPGPEYQDLLREARQVTRRLGAVRDLDVLIDFYQRRRAKGKPPERLGIDYVIAVEDRERGRARRPMLKALRRMEEDDLSGRLRRFLREEGAAYRFGLHAPGPRRQRVDPLGSFRAAAPPILEDRFQTLYSYEPYVDDPNEVEELHAMRIAAKWFRYTLELFAPAWADGLKPEIGAVKKLQELLGDLHDSDVRLELLRGMLDGPPDLRGLEAVGQLLPDPVMMSLGLLLAREERDRRGYYEAFRKEWGKLAKKDFARSCRERIQQPDAGTEPRPS